MAQAVEHLLFKWEALFLSYQKTTKNHVTGQRNSGKTVGLENSNNSMMLSQ
jgi:hypothetical protein